MSSIIVGTDQHRERDLLQIVETLDSFSFFPCSPEGGQKQSGDRDNNEKLHQCESINPIHAVLMLKALLLVAQGQKQSC
jgi:hypothetical protein